MIIHIILIVTIRQREMQNKHTSQWQKSEDAKLFATVLTDYILDKKEVSEC